MLGGLEQDVECGCVEGVGVECGCVEGDGVECGCVEEGGDGFEAVLSSL